MALVRTAVVRCRHWPVVAAGASPHDLAAVFVANRVVSATPGALAAGIEVGQLRRAAQARCPSVEVLERDERREARAFEAVVRAVETFTPRIELTFPGVCAFATRGPSRYFGGDPTLAGAVVAAVDEILNPLGWAGHVRVGVADSPFAAVLATRFPPPSTPADPAPSDPAASDPPSGAAFVVPAEHTPSFLAPLPITVLSDVSGGAAVVGGDDLVGVLQRLGLRTLGAFAALTEADVLARFGVEGAWAHRLAAGRDPRPPAVTDPPPELTVEAVVDPPADRVDHAAFVAKAMADDLALRLSTRALSCTRIAVFAETEHGEVIERLWRHEGALGPGAIADRVRWQLDGWLNGPAATRPSSGITFLRLTPDEVVPATGRQLGFWGGETAAAERAARALARVQGLFGADASPDAVAVPEWRGGRGPAEQVVLVPAQAVDLTEPRPTAVAPRVPAPWPGQVPAPSPAVVHHDRLGADVIDSDGCVVRVSGRGETSAALAEVAIDGGPFVPVRAWAGPWPADERWWDPASHRRRARFQVVLAGGVAHLLAVEGGAWWVEATYD